MTTKSIKVGNKVYDLDVRSETHEGIIALIAKEVEKAKDALCSPSNEATTALTRGRIHALRQLLKDITPTEQ